MREANEQLVASLNQLQRALTKSECRGQLLELELELAQLERDIALAQNAVLRERLVGR